MSVNLWFEHIIDAYLQACAEGGDWHAACATAERNIGDKPRRVLTQKGLAEKGITYGRQHLVRRVADNSFPAPFHLPDFSEAYTSDWKAKEQEARKARGREAQRIRKAKQLEAQRKATAASGNEIIEG